RQNYPDFMKPCGTAFAGAVFCLAWVWGAADMAAAGNWHRQEGTIYMRHPVTDADVEAVSHESGVTNLSLDPGWMTGSMSLTNVSLAPLARLTTLRSLNLNHRQVKDSELSHLSSLTNLES